jgi:hypothetical protein
MMNVIQRAIDVQMYSMGSSVYEERTWKKKASPSVTSAASTLPAAPVTTEPSLTLKCPYSGASLSSAAPPIPPPEAVSSPQGPPPPSAAPSSDTTASKCPYHPKESHPSAETSTETPSKPAGKCPFASEIDDNDDRLSFGSLDDGEGGSCPFGAIQPELPAVTEDTFQLIAERLQALSSSKNSEHIFENHFLQERCAFVAYDGTMIPW